MTVSGRRATAARYLPPTSSASASTERRPTSRSTPASSGSRSPEAMMTVSFGSELAGYRIEDEIARGGMGVVYRATELALERPVALKLIAPELTRDPSFRER